MSIVSETGNRLFIPEPEKGNPLRKPKEYWGHLKKSNHPPGFSTWRVV